MEKILLVVLGFYVIAREIKSIGDYAEGIIDTMSLMIITIINFLVYAVIMYFLFI